MFKSGSWMVILICACLEASGFQAGYKVGRMDVIRIEVAGDPDFSRDAVVSEMGTISYGIVGEIKVEGLTAGEISEVVRKALIDRRILVRPSVFVSIKEYRSQSATVLGEVKNPGRYYLKGSEKLLDVIAEAGGANPTAGEISISRTAAGAHRILTVKAGDLLRDSTPIESGDVIFIKPKPVSQVFVSGDVAAGKPLTYTEGMTVSQAIIMAGGLSRFGSKSKITIRRTENDKEILIKVNLSEIEKGKAKDVPLLPNDHVFVGRRIF